MKKRRRSYIVAGILLLVGLCVLAYPSVSNWLADHRAVVEVQDYDGYVSSLSKEYVDAELAKAADYNNSLAGDPVKDPFVPGSGRALPTNYLEVLNENGVMCHIEIPKVDINLPVYHGVSDEVLEKGVGHMEGTALPIGQRGGNALLTGHTGLPSAKLFTDLEKLEVGDVFYIHTLGKELVYEIDEIKVIEPSDLSDLTAYADKDYVTLLTCTPYGVNSHRLLVRGVRTYAFSKSIVLAAHNPAGDIAVFGAASLISLLMLFFALWRNVRVRRKKRAHKKAMVAA